MTSDERHDTRPATPVSLTLIPAAGLRAVAWKNGGGLTREVVAVPAGAAFDTFDWRVSLADVAQPGAFSRFAGIDRVLVMTGGTAMVLVDGATGARRALSRWDTAEFAGEACLRAELPAGPTRDFNLMVRRGRATGRVAVHRGAHRLYPGAGSTLLHCAAGAYLVGGAVLGVTAHRLDAGGSAHIEAAAGCTIDITPLTGDAVLLDARIAPARGEKPKGKNHDA